MRHLLAALLLLLLAREVQSGNYAHASKKRLYTVKVEYTTGNWAGMLAVCVEATNRISARTEARELIYQAYRDGRIEDTEVWPDDCDRLKDM